MKQPDEYLDEVLEAIKSRPKTYHGDFIIGVRGEKVVCVSSYDPNPPEIKLAYYSDAKLAGGLSRRQWDLICQKLVNYWRHKS